MNAHSNSPLAQADKIVGGSRLKNYGTPLDNHSNTAALWGEWFSRKMRKEINFDAADVCMFNILQKCSREANSHHDDNMVDICGYAQNDWLCRDSVLQSDGCTEGPRNIEIAPFENHPRPTELLVDEPLRFYVSGPFSAVLKEDRARNIMTAKVVAAILARKGHLVHCPHAATEFMDGHFPWQYFMDLDETIVKLWSNANFNIAPSPGADKEVNWSKEKGDPVYTRLIDVPTVKGVNNGNPAASVEQNQSISDTIRVVDEAQSNDSNETVRANSEHQAKAKPVFTGGSKQGH